jgi:hypothetical protein
MGAEPYAAQFKALGPLSIAVSTDVDYVQLYTVLGNNLDSPVCSRNKNLDVAGVNLPEWDLIGLRKAYDVHNEASADPRFQLTILLLENYGMQGVRAVDPSTTALAPEERELAILAGPAIFWEGEDEQTKKDANAYIEAMREALFTGVDKNNQNRHTYVNYAKGAEKAQQLYGYDDRLHRLTMLKKQWDPKNQFGFYNPILQN